MSMPLTIGLDSDILDDIDSDKRSKIILQASRQMINAAAQTDSEKSDIEVVPNPGRHPDVQGLQCLAQITWMHRAKFSTR